MNEIWSEIHAWFRSHNLLISEIMNDGATDAQIANFESELSFKLPDEIKQSYQVHNGQALRNSACGLINGKWRLLPLEEILEHWPFHGLNDEIISPTDDISEGNRQYLIDSEVQLPLFTMKSFGPIKPVWWTRKWVPIAYDNGGAYIMIDLDPCPEGDIGQLILWFHDDEHLTLVSKSYSIWLHNFAADLQSNIYRLDEESGCLVPRREFIYSFNEDFGWLPASLIVQ
jgi:cell wall assembly regulator SMI1